MIMYLAKENSHLLAVAQLLELLGRHIIGDKALLHPHELILELRTQLHSISGYQERKALPPLNSCIPQWHECPGRFGTSKLFPFVHRLLVFPHSPQSSFKKEVGKVSLTVFPSLLSLEYLN